MAVELTAYNLAMPLSSWSIRALRPELANSTLRATELAEQALARSSRNDSRNTYLWQDAAWTLAEAKRAEAMPRGAGGSFDDGRAALYGLPVSVKDCFDLAGAPTTCGVHFYRDLGGNATRDSWLVEQLRAAGAVIVGKTHLHPLAYGITGENPEFGDCVQPGDPGALTGGSSSGAVASVLEGSAVAAIGTDTGGSVRVPAVLCGLAGYRATLGRGDWRGGAHLAESFDTMGWLFRDLEDAPLLAAPFAPDTTIPTAAFGRFAYVADSFLHDCEPAVAESLRATVRELESLGLYGQPVDPEWWQECTEIFAPIQAWEAARLHAGHYDQFQRPIRERLVWGARIPVQEIVALRERLTGFRARMDELFAAHELLLLPAAPVARLAVGADHSQTRVRLLRYTTPVSLAGAPAIAIPCSAGGMQLAATPGNDESLLKLAAQLGTRRKMMRA
ncbi:MAG TPA: amidase [Terracidiphilus sp.]|jgi:aspartyl-tRNA(Asn)/glutamyl-tRNA(Gln) amidotransferase subunit A|nr:amidase [Terracidiphilus sp.]